MNPFVVGATPSTMHSKVAMEWLTWCTQQQQTIQHARNASEYRIPGTDFHVDGFDASTNTIYEFHGCFWHGCPRCYPTRHETYLRHYDRTMQDVYETTQQRTQQLKEARVHCRGNVGM